MARPIEFTTPVPAVLIAAFGGAADTNLLPAQPALTNYTPLYAGSYYDDGATIEGAPYPIASGGTVDNPIPSATPLVVGYTTNNKIALNRDLRITTTADLTGETITLRGYNNRTGEILTENIAGPIAGGSATSVNQYSILYSFTCTDDTAEDNFELAHGVNLTTSPVRISTFFPSTGFQVAIQMFGTAGTWQPFGTTQNFIKFRQDSTPYIDNTILWTQLSNASNSTGTIVPASVSAVRRGIYFVGTGNVNRTTYWTYVMTQQGVV